MNQPNPTTTADAPPCATAASVKHADEKQLWELVYHMEHFPPHVRDFFISMGTYLAEQKRKAEVAP